MSVGEKENYKKLDEIIASSDGRGDLIEILHQVQDLFGYIPKKAIAKIAKGLKMQIAEIYGVITFYSRFTLVPTGDYSISVCMGTACYVKGAQQILTNIEQKLGIKEGETTVDGKFSIVGSRCIGACGLAPVMTINEDVYGRLLPGEVDEILEKYI